MYSVDLQTSVWNVQPGKPNVTAIFIQAFGAHSLDPKSQIDLKFLPSVDAMFPPYTETGFAPNKIQTDLISGSFLLNSKNQGPR